MKHQRAVRLALIPSVMMITLLGCRRSGFPDVPAGYHEYAYVTNGSSNTVTVLDLVALRPDRTLRVGDQPTGIAVNPRRNEVYAVNTKSGSVSVIDATTNSIAATIGVHHQPYFISVDAQGGRAYVANAGSNSVSVIDLDKRQEIAVVGTGEQPGVAKIAPDMRSLVVSNRGSGSVSVYAVEPYISTYRGPGGGSPDAPAPAAPAHPAEIHGPALKLRAAFPGCSGATDVAILPDSSKAFVACSGGHQVMAISLAAAPDSWAAKQNANAMADHLLTMLDVGRSPVHLAMKPDGGEIFTANFDDDTVSEIYTWTNEVGGTYTIGSKPTNGLVSRDNSTLWVANFGADLISIYSIDDGQLVTTIHTGSAPDSLAFSTDEHLLLVADAHSGDVAVIRTQGRQGAALFTMLPAGGSPNGIVVKSYTVR